jgi:RNA polymerase sigma factor (sigma-70 family)
MDQQEFKSRVFSLKNKLYRFARRWMNSAEEAEDIVQDVFIRLWNRRERLGEYRSVEALAMVTTRNLCIDKLKVRKLTTERIEDLRSEVEDVKTEERSEISLLVQRIREIIPSLPLQQRIVIQLRDIEGYDFEEIAEIMDMNENAVRVNLSRARKRIRELITEQRIYEHPGN